MKITILALFVSLMITPAFAAQVKAVKLDSSKQNLLIDVTYGGGCGDHKFSLKMEGCLESFPIQCTAQLVEKTRDACEGLITTTLKLSLDEAGLIGSYYRRGYLTIMGDQDWQLKKPSQATVRLP